MTGGAIHRQVLVVTTIVTANDNENVVVTTIVSATTTMRTSTTIEQHFSGYGLLRRTPAIPNKSRSRSPTHQRFGSPINLRSKKSKLNFRGGWRQRRRKQQEGWVGGTDIHRVCSLVCTHARMAAWLQSGEVEEEEAEEAEEEEG